MVWAIIRVRSKSMCMCMSASMSNSDSGKGAHMVEGGLAAARSVAMVVDRVVLTWKGVNLILITRSGGTDHQSLSRLGACGVEPGPCWP